MSVKLTAKPQFELKDWGVTSFDFRKDGSYIYFSVMETTTLITVAYDIMQDRAVAVKGQARLEEVTKYVRDYMKGTNYR